MKTRNFALCSLGLAAAITLGGAATASAQARSDQRIPVRKDQPAEQAPPRVDTIRVVRVDTVTLRGRVDTVTIRTRPDTVVQMQMLPMRKLPQLYFGLGAGLEVPYQSFRNGTKDGPLVQAMVGWFPANGNIGIRADGVAAFLRARDTDCPACPDPKLYQGSADLVLRMPLDRTSKLNPVLYLLGGGGVNKFDNFIPYRNTDNKIVTAGTTTFLRYPNATTPLVTAATAGTGSVFFHYEGGLGLDVDIFNATHLYIESKFQTIQTRGANSHTIPISAGLKFGW